MLDHDDVDAQDSSASALTTHSIDLHNHNNDKIWALQRDRRLTRLTGSAVATTTVTAAIAATPVVALAVTHLTSSGSSGNSNVITQCQRKQKSDANLIEINQN